MAFTIYNVFYYYCCYYKTCLQADEWKVHCAWKIPNIAWRKKRLHDTDPAKRTSLQNDVVTQWSCCFIMQKTAFILDITQNKLKITNSNDQNPLWNRIVMQFVKNYPAFYVIDNFITMFTRLRFHILLRTSLIQSLPSEVTSLILVKGESLINKHTVHTVWVLYFKL